MYGHSEEGIKVCLGICVSVSVTEIIFESLLLAVKKPMPPYTVAFGKVKNCIIIIILVFIYHLNRHEQLTVTSSLIERQLLKKIYISWRESRERTEITNVVIKFVLTVNRVKIVITWSVLRFLQSMVELPDIMTADRVPYGAPLDDRARWRDTALDDDV